ncbi:MAG TPA: hypothetical protein VMF91_04155 [Bryobacteraceae bacterium]|nr:hypothetical protein [Bryobacteraceae bacterium]
MPHEIADFFKAYLSFDFWILHALIATIALGVLIRHVFALRELKQKVDARKTITSDKARRDIETLDIYGSYYDSCSNAFILVGLLGTMYGFYLGMPHKGDSAASISFEQIKPALATSAFGIIWAILLNLITRATVDLQTDRLRATYSRKANEFSLEQTLTFISEKYNESILQVGATVKSVNENLATVFNTGTTNFSDASSKLADAAKALQDSSAESAKVFSGAAKVFRESFENAAGTASRLDEVINRIIQLPETVSRQLEEFSRKHTAAMAEGAKSLSERFEALVNQLLNSLTAITQIPGILSQNLKSAHAEYVSVVAGSLETFKQTQAVVREHLKRSAEEFRATMQETTELQTRRSESFLEKLEILIIGVQGLPEQIRDRMYEIIEQHRAALEQQNKADLQSLKDMMSSLVTVSTREIEGARQKLVLSGEELRDSYIQAYKNEAELVRKEMETLFHDVERFLQQLQKDLEKAIIGAPDSITKRTESVRDVIEKLTEAAADSASALNASVERISTGLSVLGESTKALAPAVSGLEDAASKFTKAAREDPAHEQVVLLNEIKQLMQNFASTSRGPRPSGRERQGGGRWRRLFRFVSRAEN